MCLTIFCCFRWCCSAEALYDKGRVPFREGTQILEKNNKNNPAETERAYALVADGLYYFKLALWKDPEVHETYSLMAYKTISSFCASSICSPGLRRYLINHRVFAKDAEFEWYENGYMARKFEWGNWGGIYMSVRDTRNYNAQSEARSEKSRIEHERKEIEKKEATKKYWADKWKEDCEESSRRRERDEYEKAHPEAKYQRETAEAAREQVELVREQNALLKEKNRTQEKQANEQTRLLEKVADEATAARYAAERAARRW